jgi:hypothetical protein
VNAWGPPWDRRGTSRAAPLWSGLLRRRSSRLRGSGSLRPRSGGRAADSRSHRVRVSLPGCSARRSARPWPLWWPASLSTTTPRLRPARSRRSGSRHLLARRAWPPSWLGLLSPTWCPSPFYTQQCAVNNDRVCTVCQGWMHKSVQ